MSFSDWLTHFVSVEICSLATEGFNNNVRTTLYKGEWRGATAGGCLNFSGKSVFGFVNHDNIHSYKFHRNF
jgi:hypothetical protein